MLYSALFAYLHYASIIALAGSLMLELFAYHQNINEKELKMLQKADTLYGVMAILVVATGLIRSFYFEKGSEYYYSNPIFLIKFGLFLVIGILSIYPTVWFIRWGKQLKQEGVFRITQKQNTYISTILKIEVALLFIMPLLAALMARGFGY